MSTATSTTRDRILDAAELLVLERGFSAATLDAILRDAGVSKGAFFHYFDSKDELGRALLSRYAQRDADLLEEMMTAAETLSDDPATQVVEFLRAFEQAADDLTAAFPGCLFASFIYERMPGVPADDDVIVGAIVHWRERVLEKLERAAADHPRLREVDLPSLADQGFTIFEGGYVLSRATNDWSHLRSQLSHFRRYIELLVAE